MTVSNAAQAGVDRTDIADTMGHTAMELTARASMAAGATGAYAVGHAAGRTRDVMTRPQRAMVAVYKAEEKTARQLDRALRKGKPGAARAKRVADARKRAGKPIVLSDAKPSARIGGFAAKGKASRRIGKHVGGGLKKAGRGVKRLGSTGLDWMDEASARITAADDDPASQLGDATRDLTFKAVRKGVRGVTSSARFIWRHRHAPSRAVRGVRAAASTGARVARAAANLVRAAASRIAAGAASISLPVLPIIAAMIAVLGVLLAVMGAFLGSSASESTGVANVPAEYEADVVRAGSICPTVTPSIIAAQIEQESNWNPKAGSSAGAQGIAQFMPSTWASAGKDGDGDGKADIWNPHDAIWSQGNYMCGLASQVETAKKSGKLTGDTLELTLAAYNAGLGSVLRYGMVPPFEETINYVRRIKELAATKYTATGTAEGGTVGSLEPKLTVSGGIVSTAGITPDTRYPWGQCTWWAATRRADIGKPIPGWGNAATWAGSAASAGYTVDGSPSAGSVIVFQPGVLGASADYGHVAMVEEVRGGRVDPDQRVQRAWPRRRIHTRNQRLPTGRSRKWRPLHPLKGKPSMEPKRNRIIAATGFAVALLILGGNVAVICAGNGTAEDTQSTVARPRTKTEPGQKTAGDEETEPATPTEDDPCADLAPKALGVYMGDERGQLEGEYFTPDAAGLDIPASSIAPQPLPETEFTGFPVSTGRRVATCAVSTGLEASWVLDYTLTDDGWRCAAVKGPLEGGYRVHEGKPEEQK